MPLVIMKKVWDYCAYNKPFFLFVFLLFVILNFIQDIYQDTGDIWVPLMITAITLVLAGYGMTITRDRMRNGVRLPKIIITDVLVLGLKSYIVFLVYFIIQLEVLDWICAPLNFPNFELEELLLDLPNTINMLVSHDHVHAIIYIVVGSLLFYITSFFMEIAIARLADTGRIVSAFNIKGIISDINTIGWIHYTKDYTLIVLAIILFTFLGLVEMPIDFLDYVWIILLDFLIFATQFLGIGAVYSEVKMKEAD